MQTAKNLMDEIGKIVKVVKPDIKIFIGDSLAGNDTINQAREFFEYTKFDGAILTKIDADAKGGSAISIVYTTSKPIVYLGVGQGYDDIIPFDMTKFLQSVFWNTHLTNFENSVFRLEQDSEATREPRSVIEPLSNDPTIRPAGEILHPVITGAQESKGDAKPTEEHPFLSESIAEQENNTKPVGLQIESESIDKTDGSQTPFFDKNLGEDIGLPKKHEDTPLIEKKKNRFSSFFRRRKSNKGIVEETNTDRTDEKEKNMERPNLRKDESGKKDSNRESGEQENQEKEQPNDDKVYLTDEDIEDLLK
jgi:fused signal recognition particle receptor